MTHSITRQENYNTATGVSWMVRCGCGKLSKTFSSVDAANQAAEAHLLRERKRSSVKGIEEEIDGRDPIQTGDGAL